MVWFGLVRSSPSTFTIKEDESISLRYFEQKDQNICYSCERSFDARESVQCGVCRENYHTLCVLPTGNDTSTYNLFLAFKSCPIKNFMFVCNPCICSLGKDSSASRMDRVERNVNALTEEFSEIKKLVSPGARSNCKF